MRLAVLADNRTKDGALETEHGLSVYIDTGKIKVLMDTGASDLFMRNAAVMGIDLTDVDYVFISHAHRDHAGGLSYLLESNKKAHVIISSAALRGSFHSSRNGMHDITPQWPCPLPEDRFILVDREMEIEGMRIIPCIGLRHSLPKADRCLYVRNAEGVFVQDDFVHELALQIGGFLFTGCSHNGLMNIMESAVKPVHMVLGGFHLLDSDQDEDFEGEMEISQMAVALRDRYPGTIFYTGHCTGDNAFACLKRVLGGALAQFSCGMSLEIRK